jgi:hypothetical protein
MVCSHKKLQQDRNLSCTKRSIRQSDFYHIGKCCVNLRLLIMKRAWADLLLILWCKRKNVVKHFWKFLFKTQFSSHQSANCGAILQNWDIKKEIKATKHFHKTWLICFNLIKNLHVNSSLRLKWKKFIGVFHSHRDCLDTNKLIIPWVRGFIFFAALCFTQMIYWAWFWKWIVTRKLRALIKAGQWAIFHEVMACVKCRRFSSWIMSFNCSRFDLNSPLFVAVGNKTWSCARCKRSFNKVLIKSDSISCSILPRYP